MQLLAQFLLRLSFGLAVGMAITSPRQVASGFFRNHLYVTLGLTTLAALVLWQISLSAAGLAGAAAMFSFLGAACWLYEAPRAGLSMLWLVAACSIIAAIAGQPESISINAPGAMRLLATVTSGLLLGLTLAAMLLGHWYLNAPGMELAPLRRLLIATTRVVDVQVLISGVGLAADSWYRSDVSLQWLLFIALRWSFGIFGVSALLWMARQTLKIPNTQSATGILYVAVIGVFVGELTAALLSAQSAYPL
jgi:hypothetical protein